MRDKIRLVSSAGTGHFYTTDKNKKTMPEKMEIKKFDPKARKHVIYKEAKLSNFSFCQKPSTCWVFYCPKFSIMPIYNSIEPLR